ncbi:MAG: molecular chaperone [Bdellovibrionales bacterium]|nr:molecular chaperone [Oligoflexia bacterium]
MLIFARKRSVKNLLFTLFPLSLFFFAPTTKASFEFSPISANLNTEGKESVLIARLQNHEEEKVPVLIRVFNRSYDENGKEIRTPTTDLTVYPYQFTLGPKETKNVQISWRGSKDLPFEKAYRMVVEELPIDFAPRTHGNGQIRILVNYDTALYVSSKVGPPNVKLSAAEPVDDGRRVRLTLSNEGESHSVINHPEVGLRCKSENEFSVLKENQLGGLSGKNFLARNKLVLKTVLPAKLRECKNLEWTFNYKIKSDRE